MAILHDRRSLAAESDGLVGDPFIFGLEPGEIIFGIELPLRRAR